MKNFNVEAWIGKDKKRIKALKKPMFISGDGTDGFFARITQMLRDDLICGESPSLPLLVIFKEV